MYLLCHFMVWGESMNLIILSNGKKLVISTMCVCVYVCTPYTIRFSYIDITYFCSRNRRYTKFRLKALFNGVFLCKTDTPTGQMETERSKM